MTDAIANGIGRAQLADEITAAGGPVPPDPRDQDAVGRTMF